MLKNNKYRIINLSVIVLLLNIYGLILVNNALNYHSHVTSDGSIISHAHPFNKQTDSEPKKTHHHSKLELLLFFSDSYNLSEIQTKTKVLSITHFDNDFVHCNVAIISEEYSPDSSRAPPKA